MGDEFEDWVPRSKRAEAKANAASAKGKETKNENYKDKTLGKVKDLAKGADSYSRQLPIEERYASITKRFDALSIDFRTARVQYLREVNHLRSCLRRVEERFGKLSDVGIDANVYFYDHEYYEDEHIKLFAEATCIRMHAEDDDDFMSGVQAKITDRMMARIKELEDENTVLNDEITKLMKMGLKKLGKDDAAELQRLQREQAARSEAKEKEMREKALADLTGSELGLKTTREHRSQKFRNALTKARLSQMFGTQQNKAQKQEFDAIAPEKKVVNVGAFFGATGAHRATAAFRKFGNASKEQHQPQVSRSKSGLHKERDHAPMDDIRGMQIPKASRIVPRTMTGGVDGKSASDVCRMCQTRRFKIQILEQEIAKLRAQQAESSHLDVLNVGELSALLRAVSGENVVLPTRKSELVAMLTNVVEGSNLMHQAHAPEPKPLKPQGNAALRVLTALQGGSFSFKGNVSMSTEMPSVDSDSPTMSRFNERSLFSIDGEDRGISEDEAEEALRSPRPSPTVVPGSFYNACMMTKSRGADRNP